MQKLDLSDCLALKLLPESFVKLAALQKLSLNNLVALESLLELAVEGRNRAAVAPTSRGGTAPRGPYQPQEEAGQARVVHTRRPPRRA